ncbi:DUF305 domain-containing protein [Nonomuraea sp. NPDC049152]|uniref:DUF305 domain-containing protein n=1 Tax=Nonomuraea sp. NPDC049152 TaxID=3154350 RepID=UPI0033E5FFA7
MVKIRLLPAAGALALLTACGPTTGHDSATGHETAAAPSAAAPAITASAFNEADVTFARMMIPHHRQAVEMAGLAGTRAVDPEIKELAAQIKAAQDPEIKIMTDWLRAWDRPVPSGGMGHSMPGIMSEEQMKELEEAKGAAFDRRFAELMIAHHEGAIEMARTEKATGADPVVKELAETIETAQRAEVGRLRRFLDRL